MNDEELKNLWQQQPLRTPDVSAAQLMAAAQNKTTQFRRTIEARDFLELVACAVVVIIFGFYFYYERTPIVRLGWSIVIAGSLFSGWKLIHARRTNPPASPGATILESLRAELNSVRAQSNLLGSVLWWYLLPPGIGLLVATWGMPINLHAKIPATLFYVALYALIYWLNRRARTRELLPMEAQLESLIHSAATGEPIVEKHVTNLRAIALSMKAGAEVRPVEFKVAFSQLAIYGEIGFVGMWFFSMVSKTLDEIYRPGQNASFANFVAHFFTWQHVVWVVPAFVAGLVFCRLMQKTTERSLGISALGIHLCRGMTLLTWDEIKEIRPLKFLNIQSLWLIRESGEKMITPWTSLERHSELKAAVERFAPANHPIRRYLSLLRRG